MRGQIEGVKKNQALWEPEVQKLFKVTQELSTRDEI